MTENGICTLTSADGPVDEASYSDGTPLPWVELRVTDLLEGDEVGAGEEGLLWIQSASQCVDYVPDHETFVAAHDGPWFNTGDLARLQPDGSIRIVGRVKDLIIRGGENIPALEVERALALHDDIIEVVVVGIPDDRLGERACAVMTVADGAGVDLSRVQAHLDSLGMAKQYWPEYLLVREGLLRSASGKIAKDQLRIWATEELGSFQGNV
jgi:cyclohexanecarboxylate-CoA ligase